MSALTNTEATAIPTSTGITPETLKSKLADKLDATHVEIEDVSGTQNSSTTGSAAALIAISGSRGLRPDVRSYDRVCPVREENDACAASAC